MSSVSQNNQYTRREKLYGHFALARISNSPTVVSNALAGAALAVGAVVDVQIVLIGIAMVAFYTAGMYLNDLMDYEIDLQERADRPLTTGLISRSAAMTVTAGLFVLGSALLLIIGRVPWLVGGVLIGTIVLYDAWHKNNPLSPVVMGANRFLVYIVAFVAYERTLSIEVLLAGGLLWLYIIGLTFIAKSETGDSFTKYWPAAILFAPAVYFGVQLLDDPAWLVLVLVFVVWVGYSISFIYQKKQIGGGIVRLIAGVSLFDALALATTGWTDGAVAALVCFGLTIFFQQYIKGT
jgi:hypothetical protein